MSGRFASACTVTSCTAAKVRHGHDHPPVIGLHVPIARNPWGGMTINHVCFSRGRGKYNDTVYISFLATMSCVLFFFGRWIPAQPSNTAPVQAWHNRVPNKGVVHAVLVTWPQPKPWVQEICWMLWTCPSLEIYNLTEHRGTSELSYTKASLEQSCCLCGQKHHPTSGPQYHSIPISQAKDLGNLNRLCWSEEIS